MSLPHDPFGWTALAGAVLATPILLWYLLRRPPLTRFTKIMLLFGVGLFPILTAGSGNIAGYEATKTRRFCGSCHTMTPYQRDSEDPRSTSLAALHGRNQAFGHENCYACHADYGMFGTVTTKLGGMRHVYEYLSHWRGVPIDVALQQIHLRRPFQNRACTRCHSMTGPSWNQVADHSGLDTQLATGEVGCMGDGCHGPAHPFSKVGRPDHAALGGGVR